MPATTRFCGTTHLHSQPTAWCHSNPHPLEQVIRELGGELRVLTSDNKLTLEDAVPAAAGSGAGGHKRARDSGDGSDAEGKPKETTEGESRLWL